MDRRRFLKMTGLGAAGLAVPWKFDPKRGFSISTARAALGPLLPPYSLVASYPDQVYPSTQVSSPLAWTALQAKKYVDKLLAFIPAYQPTGTYQGLPLYEIQMAQVNQTLSSGLAPTPVWGYGQTTGTLTPHYPGYSFKARKGQPFWVHWINNLPATNLLHTAVDVTINGASAGPMPLAANNSGMMLAAGTPLPESRAVVHLHGGEVAHLADGWPDQWLDPSGMNGPKSKYYRYPNNQAASTLWYHDHSMASTRLNVYAGLAGLWIMQDSIEDNLPLPRNVAGHPPVEVPLVIQDRMFNNDGTLLFPTTGSGGTMTVANNARQNWPSGHPTWNPEFFGDVALVNGTVWPMLNVQPRRYRFRILNGCNARYLNLWLQVGSDVVPVNTITNVPGTPAGPFVPWYQIGSDGGLLPLAKLHPKFMLAGPAFRLDVIVDFTNYAGQSIFLVNNAPAPYPGGGGNVLTQIMKFQVGRTVDPAVPNPPIPTQPLTLYPYLNPATAVQNRIVTLNEWLAAAPNLSSMGMRLGESGGTLANLFGLDWAAPSQFNVLAGSTEIWQFVNRTGDAHPMHVHLVQFQVLDRFQIDAASFDLTGVVTPLAGTTVGRQPYDAGWKDTVHVPPGGVAAGVNGGLPTYQVTRIIASFGPRTGPYPYHCHIIDHEDNDMMRWFQVI